MWHKDQVILSFAADLDKEGVKNKWSPNRWKVLILMGMWEKKKMQYQSVSLSANIDRIPVFISC